MSEKPQPYVNTVDECDKRVMTLASRASFWCAIALITAVLMIYSQTLSFAWDEGFHLVASQLINSGKRPYLDFMFAQTPLNTYWVSFWMRAFGENWRIAHALAALETAGSVALTGDYLYRRWPSADWRLQAAITGAVLFGLNVAVVEYGTLGQAYGFCLMLIVLAFRFAVLVGGKRSVAVTGLSGLAAGAAAASSLLTIPVAPVLLIWVWSRSRDGRKWMHALVFVCGVVIPFFPVLWPLVQSPHQVIFDIFQFHLFYRQIWWEGWPIHDLEVFTAWLNCSQALILGALAISGVVFVRRSNWDRDVRAEFYLCAWVAFAICAYLMTAHPTFARYFLLSVPFGSVLAAVGLYGLTQQLRIPEKSRWPSGIVIVLIAAGLARSIYEDKQESWSWDDLEPIARKINEVTPGGAMLYAEEPIYFLSHRTPPGGLEWRSSQKIDVPMSEAARLHIVPRAELIRYIKLGMFATVETCTDAELEALGLSEIYRYKADISECAVFWGLR